MDRTNEMLSGMARIKAFARCLTCKHTEQCEAEKWVITCDKDGENCDNYLSMSEQTP